MTKHFGILVLGLLLVTPAFSQEKDGLKKRKPHAPTITSQNPVTVAEAAATFDRVDGIYRTLLHISVKPGKLASKSSALVTRSQVIERLAQLYREAEPAFKITPRSVPVDYARLRADNPQARRDVIKLIDKGCVGGYSRLATGWVKTLTPLEFGDAVGLFISRIGEMTHTPSSRWTPYLRSN